jgi:cell division cycle protein 20 (cofactor of APC complex)
MDPTLLSSPVRSSQQASGGTPVATPERQVLQDRYIPDRNAQDALMSHFYLTAKENVTPPTLHRSSGSLSLSSSVGGGRPGSLHMSPNEQEPYSSLLAKALFPEAQSSVLGIQTETNVMPPSEQERFCKSLGVVYEENRIRTFRSKGFRIIAQTPERILDAPELLDDFYLNLIDWSSRNVLTVALNHTVYLWNADDGGITQLMTTTERDNIITSVAWHSDGNVLAVGTNDTEVQLWDTEAKKMIRNIKVHAGRVGSLSWNGNILASGSRDATIALHDVRAQHVASTLCGHTQEVCGLRWSPNGQQLASGGNDNLLNVWDYRRHALETVPLWNLRDHTAAIKAISWNPVHPALLVSGGGTADKTLRFWNTQTGQCLHAIDTKSQVCGVMWSRCGTELVSSHGYSENQLTLWKYPSLKRVADLNGHTSRVLHLSMSPDGQMVVSAAGDETIRFWRCFAAPERNQVTERRADHGDASPFSDQLR